jgi:hypothetical protein
MTALTRQPENTNYLQASKFLITFDRIPTIQYFCQEVNLPGLQIPVAIINTPLLDFQSPGTKIKYSPFVMTFNVNEDISNWKEMYDWFLAIASPTGFQERNDLRLKNSKRGADNDKLYSDITLTVLSALNNPIVRVRFVDTFPLSLTDIQFDTKSSAETIITATCTFNFDYFFFESP